MSILVDKNTRLLVQGITGKSGAFHTRGCRDYGTNIVAGVTPGRGGEIFDKTIPVFDTVDEAREKTDCNATMIFVPASAAADAILEAAEAGIELIVCITEGIPVHDMMRVQHLLAHRMHQSFSKIAYAEQAQGTSEHQSPNGINIRETSTTEATKQCRAESAFGKKLTLIGPNCPGIITPGQCKIGIMPGYIHQPGSIGVVSRSGTLTYEAVWQLTSCGLGQSTCIGIGGDPIHGMTHTDALRLLNDDPKTEAIIMIGEIGGSEEEEAAAWAKENCRKPIAAFIAGSTAPEGRRMGHAGAIIQGNSGTAAGKIDALRAAGIAIAETPADIAKTLIKKMKK
ncbi:MAG: succinate--CoA ligase subunit alpha [Chthoniobacterales bacterium]